MRFFALVQQHRCPWQRHATSGHQNTPYYISLRRLRRPMAAAAARKKLRFSEIISRVYLRVMTCSWVFSTSRNTVVLYGINGFARSYHTNISIFTVFRLTADRIQAATGAAQLAPELGWPALGQGRPGARARRTGPPRVARAKVNVFVRTARTTSLK